MVKFTVKGDWKKTDNFFERVLELFGSGKFDQFGRMGVDALKKFTPVATGKTANSWYYTIERGRSTLKIIWRNSNITEEGTPIAILIQYGHGTKNGAFVQGTDFVNPAMRDMFNEIAEIAWREVIKD